MNKLSGVLIGCGSIAREHLAAVADLENVQIVAVCDLSAARAQATAERFGIARSYTGHHQLLADVRPDLVHVTTIPSAHFPIVRDCLSAGLNVLCEKPITVDYREFQVLKKLATQNHSLLMENQNFRFHSGIRRVHQLLTAGQIGDVLEVQICLYLNIFDPNGAYADKNAAHSSAVLRGGIIGDFLTHIGYLAYMFTGPVLDVRTIWTKHNGDSLFPFDQLRGLIKGQRATAYVSFSGNAQPDGFWVRVVGTKAHVETNLYEPPRFTVRRLRRGEPALMKLADGIAESGDVFKGSAVGFWRKLGGTSSYDGLSALIAGTYLAVDGRVPPPVSLEEIDAVACLVERLTTDLLP
jgi:predicted dehydrogenase